MAERQMPKLNLVERNEVAERAQKRIDDVYEDRGWVNPPKVSPGLVTIVLEVAAGVLADREA